MIDQDLNLVFALFLVFAVKLCTRLKQLGELAHSIMVEDSALFDAHCNAESDAEFGIHQSKARGVLVLPVASRSADRLAWGTDTSSSSGGSGSSSGSSGGSSSSSPDSKEWTSETSPQSSAISSQSATPARSTDASSAIEASAGALSESYSINKLSAQHTVPSTSARLSAALVNLDTAERLIPHAALSPQHNRSVRILPEFQGGMMLAPFSGEAFGNSSSAAECVAVPITPAPLAFAPKASVSENKAVAAAAAAALSVDVPALGDEWKQGEAPSGRVYYYNRRTRESRWRLPAGAVTVPSGFDTDGNPVSRIFAPATAAVSAGKPYEQQQQFLGRSVQAEKGQQQQQQEKRATAAAAVRATAVTPDSAVRRPSTASPSTAAATAVVKHAAVAQRRPLTAVTASVSNSAAGAVSTTSATTATNAAATVTPSLVSSSAVSVRAKAAVRTPVTPSLVRRVTPAARSTAKTPPSKAAAAVRGASRVFADLTPVSLDTRLRPATAASAGGRRTAVKHSPRAAAAVLVVDSVEKQCDTTSTAADELVSSINLEHSSFSSDVRSAGYTATKYSPVRHSYSGSLSHAAATAASTPAAATTAAMLVPPSSSSSSGNTAAAATVELVTLAESCDSAALECDAPLAAAGDSPEPPASVLRHAPRRQLFTEDAAAQPCVYCPYCGVRFLPGELAQHVASCVVVERARDGQTQRCVVAALLPAADTAAATGVAAVGAAISGTIGLADEVGGSSVTQDAVAAAAAATAPVAAVVAVQGEGGGGSADRSKEAVQADVPSGAADADTQDVSTTTDTATTAATQVIEQSSISPLAVTGKAVALTAATAAATEQCAECQRTFAAGRLQAHESVCKRVFGSRRPVFDATQRRLKGTPLEFFAGCEPAGSSTPSSTTTAAATGTATITATITGGSGAAAVTPLLARRSTVRPASARAGTGGRAVALKGSALTTPAVVRFDSTKLSSAGSKSAPQRGTDVRTSSQAVAAVAAGVQAIEQHDDSKNSSSSSSSSKGGEVLVAAAAVQTAAAVFACPKCEDSSSKSRQELLQHLQQCLLGIVSAPAANTVPAAASGTKRAAEVSKQQQPLSKSLRFGSSSMNSFNATTAMDVESAAAAAAAAVGVEETCLRVFCERPCAKAALSRHLLKCKQLRESRERRAQVVAVDTPPPRQQQAASTWHSDQRQQRQQQQQQRSGSKSAGSKSRPSSRYGVRSSSSGGAIGKQTAAAMAGCPHCGRSFAASAAPHHIAICERVVCRAKGPLC
jgi:WW domain/zinc-finger of a C2HC-type